MSGFLLGSHGEGMPDCGTLRGPETGEATMSAYQLSPKALSSCTGALHGLRAEASRRLRCICRGLSPPLPW